jgi:hypothetical protein
MKNVFKILVVSIVFFTLNSCTKEASFGEGLNQSSKNDVSGLSTNGSAVVSSPEASCTWNVKVAGFRFDENNPIITNGGFSTNVTINVVTGDGTRIPVMANISISETNPEQIQNGINFISEGDNGVAYIEVLFNGDVRVTVEVETGNGIRTLSFSPNTRCISPRPRPGIIQARTCFNVPTQKTLTRGVVRCDIEP